MFRAMRGTIHCITIVSIAAGLAACAGPRPVAVEPAATGEPVVETPAEAAQQVPEACEPEECFELGESIYLDWDMEGSGGASADYARARELFRRACDGLEAEGCFYLAEMWAEGSGGPRDVTQAWTHYEKACEMGWEDACLTLAEDETYTPKDEKMGRQLYMEACDLEEPPACYKLIKDYGVKPESLPTVSISSLGLALWQGAGGVEQDHELARQLFRVACEDDWDEACEALAWMHARGEGGTLDSKRARVLFAKSCKWPKDITWAEVKKSKADVDPEKACTIAECEFAYDTACLGLATLWREGKGGPKNPAMARAIFAVACLNAESESNTACHTLGTMFLEGEGGPKSKEQARKVFEEGCKRGYGDCCDAIEKM
jgi:TPR repeat protein